MNLILTRKDCRPDGVFSELTNEDGDVVAHTLEHAYDDGQGGYTAKITPGEYTCVRGEHRLAGMVKDFTTFEITGVAGHSALLFHWGNYNHDSEGCVLVGQAVVPSCGIQMITNSRATFASLMDLESGLDSFQLTVLASE